MEVYFRLSKKVSTISTLSECSFYWSACKKIPSTTLVSLKKSSIPTCISLLSSPTCDELVVFSRVFRPRFKVYSNKSLNMVKPATCCGRGDSCVCQSKATCSCGQQSAMNCSCEKKATENSISGARCSCRESYFLVPPSAARQGLRDFTNRTCIQKLPPSGRHYPFSESVTDNPYRRPSSRPVHMRPSHHRKRQRHW